MGAQELASLKETIKEYNMEVKQLRVELHEAEIAYKTGFDSFYQEFNSIMEGQNEIKKLLYNDVKTGQTGLIQSFSILKDEFAGLKAKVDTFIGEKNSKRRRMIKIWTRITVGIGVAWALFKEFWHDLYTYVKTH